MATDKQIDQPVGGKLHTFGKSRFANDKPSYFFIRNDSINEVACGDEHTAVVCESGRLFIFGKNDSGQLGLGHTNNIKKPQCVKVLKPEKIRHVACGRAHTLVSTTTGRLFAWGSNSDGQLGLGNNEDKDVPCEIEETPWGEIPIIQLGAGSQYSALLTEDGRVWVWGSNSDGQLGLGSEEPIINIPTLMPFSSETSIKTFACGAYHFVLLTNDGDVYTCGEAELGKLGLADSTGKVLTPTHVQLGMKVNSVACGGNHTLILGENGELVGFGSNSNGQLGLGDEEGSLLPISIIIGDSNNPEPIASIFCGDMHSAIISVTNELYTCGDPRHGRLCRPITSENVSNIPNLVEDFKNSQITKIACGGCHTMILAETKEENDDQNSETKEESELPPLRGTSSVGSETKNEEEPEEEEANEEENEELNENEEENSNTNELDEEKIEDDPIVDQNSNEQLQIESLSIQSVDNADYVNDNANTRDSSDTVEIGEVEREEPSPEIEDLPQEENLVEENVSETEEVPEVKEEIKTPIKKERRVRNFLNKLINKKPSSAPVDRTIADPENLRASSVGAVTEDIDNISQTNSKSTHRGSKTCVLL